VDTGGCPTPADLSSFLRGLSADTDVAIESHLSSCSLCMTIVEQLDEQSDLVIQTLAAQPASADDEAEFRRLQSELLSRSIAFTTNRLSINGASIEKLGATTESSPPGRLGAYELLDSIGRGATGTVYRVRHERLDRVFAMKVLHSDASADAESLDRFVREMKAVGRLDHPHIVRATDAGEDVGYQYLIMEYSPGLDVSEVLRRLGPLSIDDACEIARQAAMGLQHAHDHGVIHRDVKPSNLLLTSDGIVKLLDLGLVAVRSGATAGPAERNPRGTADYMAPEQWTNYANVDHRADLYSLGCTLFKMLSGAAPFHPLPGGYSSKMAAHLSADAPNLSAFRAGVPAELERLLGRLLSKRPEDRYPSAAALADDLIPFAKSADLQAIAAQLGLRPHADHSHSHHESVSVEQASDRRIGRRAAIAGCAAAVSVAGLALRRIWTPETRMQTQVWRPLEPLSPELLLSFDSGATSTYQPADHSILIDSDQYALVDLGQPLTGAFSFRTGWEPVSSECRAGIFFRYRERLEDGQQIQDFHLLEFLPSAQDGSGHSILQWSHLLVRGVPAKNEVERKLWAWTHVSAERDPLGLEVSLGIEGFPGIAWCGQKLPESAWTLTSDGRQKSQISSQRLRADYRGRLGVLVANGAARFFQPQLMYR
jgi:serine/threonine protein kinase